jgi:hypothetical protein
MPLLVLALPCPAICFNQASMEANRRQYRMLLECEIPVLALALVSLP